MAVRNNLPPQSQPWATELQRMTSDFERRIAALEAEKRNTNLTFKSATDLLTTTTGSLPRFESDTQVSSGFALSAGAPRTLSVSFPITAEKPRVLLQVGAVATAQCTNTTDRLKARVRYEIWNTEAGTFSAYDPYLFVSTMHSSLSNQNTVNASQAHRFVADTASGENLVVVSFSIDATTTANFTNTSESVANLTVNAIFTQ